MILNIYFLDVYVELNSIDSSSSAKSSNNNNGLQRIDEHDDILSKALDSNIIADLKEIIDSVGFNLNSNKTSSNENFNDNDDTSDTESDDEFKNKREMSNKNNVNINKNNLNNLKICIDDIEELNDKSNKTWFVFVIHVWNIRVPQEFNDDGESCTSWCVKR